MAWAGRIRCTVPDQRVALRSHPDGNTMEFSIRRDPVSDQPQGKIVPLRRISHVRVEVTDLEQGKNWFRDPFGLVEERSPGDEQITLTVPNTEQLVILHRVDQVAERSTRAVKGPHIDFRIAPELYPPILERFNRKEYYWGPDSTKIPWTNKAVTRSTGMIPLGFYTSDIGLNEPPAISHNVFTVGTPGTIGTAGTTTSV